MKKNPHDSQRIRYYGSVTHGCKGKKHTSQPLAPNDLKGSGRAQEFIAAATSEEYIDMKYIRTTIGNSEQYLEKIEAKVNLVQALKEEENT